MAWPVAMSLLRRDPNHASFPRCQDYASSDRLRLRLAMNTGSVRFVGYLRGARHGDGHSEMVQCNEGLRVHST
jgi:hypothetical protein